MLDTLEGMIGLHEQLCGHPLDSLNESFLEDRICQVTHLEPQQLGVWVWRATSLRIVRATFCKHVPPIHNE